MYSVFLLIWNQDAAKIFSQILQHFSFVWLFTVYWRHFYIIHVWFRLSRRFQNNSLIHASAKCVCLQNYVNQSRHPALLLSLLLLLFVAESTKQRKGNVTWYIILLKWIFYENVRFCTRKNMLIQFWMFNVEDRIEYMDYVNQEPNQEEWALFIFYTFINLRCKDAGSFVSNYEAAESLRNYINNA